MEDKMIADILILTVIAACCGLVIRRQIKIRKNPQAGCSGCSGCGINCPGNREKVIQIEGMHCEHCKQSVASELNKIDGVAAKVDLKKDRAIVSFHRPVEDETLRLAVEKAGFKVVSIG